MLLVVPQRYRLTDVSIGKMDLESSLGPREESRSSCLTLACLFRALACHEKGKEEDGWRRESESREERFSRSL